MGVNLRIPMRLPGLILPAFLKAVKENKRKVNKKWLI